MELDTLTEEQTHDLTFPLSGDLPDYHNGNNPTSLATGHHVLYYMITHTESLSIIF